MSNPNQTGPDSEGAAPSPSEAAVAAPVVPQGEMLELINGLENLLATAELRKDAYDIGYIGAIIKRASAMLAAPSAPVVQASLTDQQISAIAALHYSTWDSRIFQFARSLLAAQTIPLLERAQALIRDAAAVGQVVTIELRNQQPPSMGNFDMVAEVRPARAKERT